MYLNHESLGRKFSLEIVHLSMPDSSSLYTTGNIKSVEREAVAPSYRGDVADITWTLSVPTRPAR